jgi:hypothetical protein
MALSRQHFEAIAAAFRRAHVDHKGDPTATFPLETAAAQVAAELARFNPQFNRARFLEACKPA